MAKTAMAKTKRPAEAYYKRTLHFGGLALQVAHDLFATERVDDGTKLLLGHLPAGTPASVLDLGCGYGALGLPIAKANPSAALTLVDRDLLAVAYAQRNAEGNALTNVRALPGLGYRDLPADARYDWALCNVPARIGPEAIAYLLAGARARLTPNGEARVVVIRDLAASVERADASARRVAEGPRHFVYALPPSREAPADSLDVYARDRVDVAGMLLERPHDLADEPKRLSLYIPLWQETLPREARRVLSFRCGYGALAVVAATRFPSAQLVACDRDLLATTFARRNATSLGVNLDVREALTPLAAAGGERFDLVVGELDPSVGDAAALMELASAQAVLARGGQALVVAHERQWKHLAPKTEGATALVTRAGHILLRAAPR